MSKLELGDAMARDRAAALPDFLNGIGLDLQPISPPAPRRSSDLWQKMP